jgi:hypothetical protein
MPKVVTVDDTIRHIFYIECCTSPAQGRLRCGATFPAAARALSFVNAIKCTPSVRFPQPLLDYDISVKRNELLPNVISPGAESQSKRQSIELVLSLSCIILVSLSFAVRVS